MSAYCGKKSLSRLLVSTVIQDVGCIRKYWSSSSKIGREFWTYWPQTHELFIFDISVLRRQYEWQLQIHQWWLETEVLCMPGSNWNFLEQDMFWINLKGIDNSSRVPSHTRRSGILTASVFYLGMASIHKDRPTYSRFKMLHKKKHRQLEDY
jgi:hypothetical protein